MIRGRDYNKSRCDGFPAFTASQWQELEQQLLTYRYIISGIPVPPQLISTVITDPSAFFPLQQSLPCKLFLLFLKSYIDIYVGFLLLSECTKMNQLNQ